MDTVEISLAFLGNDSDHHVIDFYDASRALIGFQRSLAITTHAILNNEVITQAPSLKNARIYVSSPEAGSWKVTALVATTIWTLGTAPRDTPFGNVISSAYDYVVSESLGFHVDYDLTLLKQYEDYQRGQGQTKVMTQARLDDVIEKSHNAIEDMHRPIMFSETAGLARVSAGPFGAGDPIGPHLDKSTYEYINYSEERPEEVKYLGRVSAYSKNTFRGRMYIRAEGRAVAFELQQGTRSRREVGLIVNSLRANAVDNSSPHLDIGVTALRVVSKTGKLKKLLVVAVYSPGQLL